MVEYWGKLLIEHNEDNTVERIVLQSVEDKSIFVPNRSTFLKYVAGKLYERYGRKVLIKNYVIQ
jgi:5-formaminoimidazole-4-carboxamide-1-beta-D-ribofuranosyl 5'-monophosphate synthetase